MTWRATTRGFLPYLIVAGGGLLIGYLIAFLFLFPSEIVPDEDEVPNVVGLAYDEASRRLTAAGFTATNGARVFDATAPRNSVLRQDPAAGTARRAGARVILDVSGGQRRGAVPNVMGMTRQEAESALLEAGFELGEVTEEGSNAPRGAVIGTMPGPDAAVTLPATVALVVSSGPTSVEVPDLLGRSLGEARAMLEQLGLSAGGVTVDSAAIQAPNSVVAQSPAAGQIVRTGTAIELTVSGRQ